MTEPTERDRENAEWLRDRAGLLPDIAKVWVTACMEILAAAREEGRRAARGPPAREHEYVPMSAFGGQECRHCGHIPGKDVDHGCGIRRQ